MSTQVTPSGNIVAALENNVDAEIQEAEEDIDKLEDKVYKLETRLLDLRAFKRRLNRNKQNGIHRNNESSPTGAG